MMAPYADEIATHEFEKLEPIGRVTLRPRKVNWKNVGDNYSDALHIPVAHPGPHAIVWRHAIASSRASGSTACRASSATSPRATGPERMYQKYLPAAEHLPAGQAPLLGVFQAVAELRVRRVSRTRWTSCSGCRSRPPRRLIREIGYARPDARREMRVARYCNWRINRQVNEEDRVLIERVQNGMASGSYRVGPLAAGEVALRSFGKRLRTLIPECSEPAPPAAGWSRRPRRGLTS